MLLYALLSPSDKAYIGITRTSLEKRWAAHARCANAGKKHPLYDAMRKHGADTFKRQILLDGLTEDEAKAAEIEFIAALSTQNREHGYNLSPGGDYNAEAGAAAMRARLADPEFKAGYLARLSAVKKSRDWSNYKALSESALAWRRANARVAYAHSRRAARIATKSQGHPWAGVPGLVPGTFGRLHIPTAAVESARRAYFTRKRATEQWALRTDGDREQVAAKISASQTAHWASLDEAARAEKEAQVARARSKIDRKKQGAAASAGIKAWWVELRSDPVRYAEHIARRKASLLKTLEEKQNAQG